MNNTSFYSTVLSIRWRKKMGGMNFWARLHGQKLENVHSEGLPLAVSAAFIAAPALMNLGWLQSLSRSLVMHFLSLFFTNVLFYATLHPALSAHPTPFWAAAQRGRWLMLSHVWGFSPPPPPPSPPPPSAKSYQILPNSAKFCQILPNSAKFYQISSNLAKCCHILPIFAKIFEILPISAKFGYQPSYQVLCLFVWKHRSWTRSGPLLCTLPHLNHMGRPSDAFATKIFFCFVVFGLTAAVVTSNIASALLHVTAVATVDVV